MRENSVQRFVQLLLAVSLGAFSIQGMAYASGHARVPEIQDLLNAKVLHPQGVTVAFSPDGKWIATTVCDPARALFVEEGEINRSSREAARNSLGCDIWLYSSLAIEARNLTLGAGSNWSPAWSPDGQMIAFYSDRDGRPKMWLWDRRTDAVRKLSESVARQQFGFEAPLWLPDGEQVLVKLMPESVDPEIADVEKHGRAPGREDRVTVNVFVSPAPPVSSGEEVGAQSSPVPMEHSADFAIVDVRTGRMRRVAFGTDAVMQKLSPNGRFLAYLEQRPRAGDVYSPYALVVLDLEVGTRRVLVPAVQPGFPGALSWAPDSRQIAYISMESESDSDKGGATSTSLQPSGGNLYFVSITEGNAKRALGVPENHFLTSAQPPLWSPDGSHIYLVGVDGQVWKVDAAAIRAAKMTSDPQRAYSRLVGSADGNTLAVTSDSQFAYAITRHVRNHRNGIARIDLMTGTSDQKLEEDRFYGSEFESSVMSPDRKRVVFQAESSYESPELWISDLTFRKPHQLSNLNPELNELKFGKSRLIEFESHDGQRLQGTVLLPSDYLPGKRYPTIVWVYASDAEATRNINHFGLFDPRSFNMQMLAARGYAVLWPDIPTRVGSPIDDLMKSVMPAIDKAVELGIADPEKLAVMGNSNGGYSTLALITRTRRFKAAVMNAGFGDLTAFHGTMGGIFVPWIEKMGGSMGVPPWEDPFRYVENSPIFKLDRINTPIIIQAGTQDRSIIQHSDQVWVEMQRLQKPAIYLRYDGEDHVLRGTSNLRDYWRRVLEFYGQHLSMDEASGAIHSDH